MRRDVRLLVVEDDPVCSKALSTFLSHLGYPVESVTTLHDAEEKLNWQPDYVLLDLMLPDGSGVDLLKRIREEHLPMRVAVMTGVHEGPMLDEVRELRPERVYRKPLDIPAMMTWIAKTA